MFGGKERRAAKQEKKEQEKIDGFMEKYQLEDMTEGDMKALERIALELNGKGLLKAGMALSFAKVEEQAKVSYLSALVEQNFLVLSQLSRLNKNIEELKDSKGNE